MEYYILVNNIKQGPFQKEELIQKGITGNTMVWCTGMSDWKKAAEVADLTDILQQTPPEPPQNIRIMPKTWLVESILVTIFCCLPFGIVGIINATKVENLYLSGQYDMAEYYSNQAKKWTLWGLIASLIIGALYIILVVGFSLIPFLCFSV